MFEARQAALLASLQNSPSMSKIQLCYYIYSAIRQLLCGLKMFAHSSITARNTNACFEEKIFFNTPLPKEKEL